MKIKCIWECSKIQKRYSIIKNIITINFLLKPKTPLPTTLLLLPTIIASRIKFNLLSLTPPVQSRPTSLSDFSLLVPSASPCIYIQTVFDCGSPGTPSYSPQNHAASSLWNALLLSLLHLIILYWPFQSQHHHSLKPFQPLPRVPSSLPHPPCLAPSLHWPYFFWVKMRSEFFLPNSLWVSQWQGPCFGSHAFPVCSLTQNECVMHLLTSLYNAHVFLL